MQVFLDCETRSECDIAGGVDRYAAHRTTRVLCLASAVDDEPVAIWTPGAPLPAWLSRLDDCELHAHNARFERLIWRHCLHDWPQPRLSQWHCTAAQAAAAGLPRALGRAAIAAGLPIEKDREGKRLIRKLCQPRRPTLADKSQWCNDLRELTRLYDYCARDVEVERLLARRLPPLCDRERTVWLLDQLINDRGFSVDLPLVEQVLQLYDQHERRLVRSLSTLTDHAVTGGSQVARLLSWLEGQGVYAGDLTSETVTRLLQDDLTPPARAVLQIRGQLAKASVKKYLAVKERTCPDGRLRGSHLYFGAHTGRWSGQGFQPQNLPRGILRVDQIEPAIQAVRAGLQVFSLQHQDVSGALSSLIRPVICAKPKHRLIVVDFAGVEARVLAWLAGQTDLVAQFRAGEDTYRTLAAEIYGVSLPEVTKEQRQVGKMARLGLGYSMGAEKFRQSCEKAGVQLEAEFCEQVVRTYRTASAKIVAWWRAIEQAAIDCVRYGKKQKASGVLWYRHADWLMGRLASGRPIPYYMPQITSQDTRFGRKATLSYLAESSVTRQFRQERTYGGKLAENLVQGTCRDLLCDALVRLEQRGYRTVLHVHDEVVIEHPIGSGSLTEVESIVSEVPTWARGCPIGVEGFESERYRK